MLCFASAQDRTNPRRIKGYFNANGARPPLIPARKITKLEGETLHAAVVQTP
jgi:hypothetical protein